MADVTEQFEIDQDWTELSGAVTLAGGSTYALDIAQANSHATVFSADTDSNVAPTANIIGHPWKPGDKDTPIDPRLLEYSAGTFIWMRVDHGTATIAVTVK